MALVAVFFIAAFGFALARHHGGQQPAPLERPSSPLESNDFADPPVAAAPQPSAVRVGNTFICDRHRVIDGDTVHCGDISVRLASIDSPEMPGHCRRGRTCVPGDPIASKTNLETLIAGGEIICRQTDTDRYGRVVAFCSVKERDLSCAQVEGGFAIIRYGELRCPSP